MSHEELAKVKNKKLIHLTTLGRKTAKPHMVELWFAMNRDRVYLSHEGEDTDWMKNIEKHEHVSFEIGGRNFTGKARLLDNKAEEAWEGKVALYEKYYVKASKETIEDWFSLSKLLLIELYK
jgi:deazaflavin-dependent oxidoreductase (nitroreductase family)